MQIHRDLFRQADFIEQSLDNLLTAFIEGAALVILVVVVFLMNMRAAVITLLALPLSLVAAVIAMDRFGLTINSMSLGGLAIAIGELVDDAIIDVENVVRRLRENAHDRNPGACPCSRSSTGQARRFGTRSSSRPSSSRWSSCRCSCWAASRAGCCGPLGFGYVVALTASLVVALTVTPVLCSWLPADVTSDCVGYRAAVDANASRRRTSDGSATRSAYWRTVLATAAVLSGGCARGHRRRGPIVSPRVQRRCLDRQRRDDSGHAASLIPTRSAMPSSG